MSGIDKFTRIDNKLNRTNTLLANLVDAQGTADLPESTDTVPYGTITFPDDRQYFGLPNGKTTVDFGSGEVEHDTEGKLQDIGDVRSISRALDSTLNKLRSLYVYVDAPAQLSFDGDNTRTLEAGQHYTFTDSGFTTVSLDCPYSTDVTMAAGTRRTNASVAGSGAHSERRGQRTADTHNTWADIVVGTAEVWNNDDIPNTLGETLDDSWYVRVFENITAQVVNSSDSNGAVDFRVLARDVRADDPNSEADDYYEIARQTGVGAGARHKFNINEPHHELKFQFRNATDGTLVGCGMTGVGVS